jgi:hypothetical protein
MARPPEAIEVTGDAMLFGVTDAAELIFEALAFAAEGEVDVLDLLRRRGDGLSAAVRDTERCCSLLTAGSQGGRTELPLEMLPDLFTLLDEGDDTVRSEELLLYLANRIECSPSFNSLRTSRSVRSSSKEAALDALSTAFLAV